MTKAMAIDHGKQGIRVNCLCPGDVDTPMLASDAEKPRALLRRLHEGRRQSSARPGRHGGGAGAGGALLASDDSSFMTGAALVVDGGGIAD